MGGGGGEAGEKGVAPGQLPFPLMYDPPSLLPYTSGQTRVAYGFQWEGLLGGGGGTESSKKDNHEAAVWRAVPPQLPKTTTTMPSEIRPPYLPSSTYEPSLQRRDPSNAIRGLSFSSLPAYRGWTISAP